MIIGLYMRAAIIFFVSVALAAAVWKIRHGGLVDGRAEVRAEWQADIAQRTAAALVASEAARATERALTSAKQKVEAEYANEKKRRAAADLLVADGLRKLQNAISAGSRATGADTATKPGDDADPRDSIVAECASALVRLDKEARSMAGQVIGLQGYTSGVCVSK